MTETQKQVAGGNESSTVRNPIDYMTSTDIALWESVTGGTIEGGKAYLPDVTEGNTEAGSDLIEAIYEMRAHGTFDSLGNRVALSGDISVEDMQGYIDHYRPGGWVSSDTHVLDLALTELTTD
ncbi:hypothetical protein [Rhizobium alvei]|uniref:Uncharacterized protein n=1 Tax=Rhizobium alvei TaxID=1132659 RepID=A0ABT8YHH5_9HYPH|nr:hypothetical protein [Rhizobium alvei]MDO6963136.1 hypothetical protein [Rhizobium alvei]